MTTELWMPVVEYEGLYEISNFGRIRSLIKRGNSILKIKKTSLDIKTGYITVQLRKNNIPVTKRIHRLVAEAHLPNLENKPCVNHKDGNKTNCNLDNLEWTTYSENTLHSFKNGLQKKIFGDSNYITKISDLQVLEIRQLIKEGKTNKDIAKIYQVNPSQISRIKCNKRRHTTSL